MPWNLLESPDGDLYEHADGTLVTDENGAPCCCGPPPPPPATNCCTNNVGGVGSLSAVLPYSWRLFGSVSGFSATTPFDESVAGSFSTGTNCLGGVPGFIRTITQGLRLNLAQFRADLDTTVFKTVGFPTTPPSASLNVLPVSGLGPSLTSEFALLWDAGRGGFGFGLFVDLNGDLVGGAIDLSVEGEGYDFNASVNTTPTPGLIVSSGITVYEWHGDVIGRFGNRDRFDLSATLEWSIDRLARCPGGESATLPPICPRCTAITDPARSSCSVCGFCVGCG